MKLIIFDFNKTLYDPAAQRLFPGALAALEHFKALGATLILLSTESQGRVPLLKRLGISTEFGAIYFVADKGAAFIKTILSAHEVAPQDALIIGDDPEGELQVAQQLHIPAIAVGTGFCDQQTALRLGAAFCSSIKDVPEATL